MPTGMPMTMHAIAPPTASCKDVIYLPPLRGACHHGTGGVFEGIGSEKFYAKKI